MRVSLRHPNGSHSFLDEGSAFGHRLLQCCVNSEVESKSLGRRGLELPPIQASEVGESMHQIHATGVGSILGEGLSDIGKSRELEFNACHIHSGGSVHSVHHREMNVFLKDTFHSVVDSMHMQGFSTSSSRFDLFHGHMFRSDPITTSGSTTPFALLGILFHCSEFPARTIKQSHDAEESIHNDEKEKPILEGIDLGYCQEGSDCRPSLEEWRFRNVLWSTWWPSDVDSVRDTHDADMKQGIWLLDGAAPDMAKLRVDGTEFGADCPNTFNEDFLGTPIGDILFLNDNLYFTPRLLHGEPYDNHLL